LNNAQQNALIQNLDKYIKAISKWWYSLSKHTTILILDWLVVVAAAALLAVIYLPKEIWAEEEASRVESRRRMQIINDSEDFYHTVTGNYTTDGEFLFKLVTQLHDSLIADSTFFDDVVIDVGGAPYTLQVPEGLLSQLDTTFSVGRPVREQVADTTYTILVWNTERGNNDTIYIGGARSLAAIEQDPNFRGSIETVYGEHIEVDTDYDWFRFHLIPELLRDPVTNEPFIIGLDSTGLELTVASPLSDSYHETRYLLFRFKPRNHGKIVDGEPSW